MTIDELIAELNEIKERNREPEVPTFDPGTIQVKVQSEEGTYESDIKDCEMVADVWLIVAEPNYDL